MLKNSMVPLAIIIVTVTGAVTAITLAYFAKRVPATGNQVEVLGSPTIIGDDGPSLNKPVSGNSNLYFTVLDETFIEADGPDGEDTYRIIREQLCPDGDPSQPECIEAPDLYPNNHPGVRHIIENIGSPFGPYFTFVIHDVDKNKNYGDASTMQRNEIKGYGGSPSRVLSTEGQSYRYHWYFRIPINYYASNTIMFQLHSVAEINEEQVGPIVKIESVGSNLVFRHDPDNCGDRNPGPGCNSEVLDSVPLSGLRGQWLEAEVFATYTNSGFLHMTIRDQTHAVVMAADRNKIDMWTSSNENAPFTRPKWGIYRGLSNTNSQGTIDFADIRIQEISLHQPP
jgi:hypothetical protein